MAVLSWQSGIQISSFSCLLLFSLLTLYNFLVQFCNNRVFQKICLNATTGISCEQIFNNRLYKRIFLHCHFNEGQGSENVHKLNNIEPSHQLMCLLTLILLEPKVISLCHQYREASLYICG